MPHPGTRRADFDGATPITLSPLQEAHAGQGHQAGPIYLSRDKIDRKTVFRRADDGAMRRALLPVTVAWVRRRYVFEKLKSPADAVV